MATKYLDKTGLTYFWGKIKALIPTKTSDLTNDAGFVNSAGAASAAPVQSVNGQTGTVALTIPTKTSDLTNDSGYITSAPVASVNGQTGAVVLDADDVGALPDDTAIPSKTSDLVNDSDFTKLCYGTCSTAAATVQKEVTISNVTALSTGLTILVKFTYANTASNPTLKVNSLAAASIKRYGTTAASTSAASSWNAGAVVPLTYDGTYWQINGWINTTYSSMTDAEITAGTGTTARTITPARLKTAIQTWENVSSVNGQTGAVTLSIPTVPSNIVNTFNSQTGDVIVGTLTSADIQTGTDTTSKLVTAKAIADTLSGLGGGTVLSVGLANKSGETDFTIAGSPITSSGTFTIEHANSVTAKTTKGVYPITFDKHGHITAADSAVAIPTKISDLTNDAGYVTAAGASSAAPVQSVNGATGTVVLDASDVGALPDSTQFVGSVAVTPSLSSGTKVGTINVDGTSTDLYAPTDTDTKVTQTATTTTDYTYWRGLCIGNSAVSAEGTGFSTVTDQVRTFNNLRVQPSTGTIKANIFKGDLTGDVTGTASGNLKSGDNISSLTNDEGYVDAAGAAAAAPVQSVNGQTGTVALSASDVGALSTSGGTVNGDTKVSANLTANVLAVNQPQNASGNRPIIYFNNAAGDNCGIVYFNVYQKNGIYTPYRFLVKEPSLSSATNAPLQYGENYNLPAPDFDRTANITYGIWTTKSIPEPPAANGTYTLQATRTSSGVTYSWV